MEAIARASAAIAVIVAAAWPAAPAHAIPRTFVSATGGGAACTRALPCATFQAAHDATDPNGEINCIDAGQFGGLLITKSITIDCSGTIGAGANTVTINTTTAVVRLRGLTFEGPGDGSFFAGVAILSHAAALFVENCAIDKFATGISAGAASGGTTRLSVADSAISNTADGISINGQGSSRLVIDRVRLEKDDQALRASGVSPATGPIIVQIRASVFTGNAMGVRALTSGGFGGQTISVTVDRTSSTISDNGVIADGSTSFVLLGRSTVMGNSTGLSRLNGGTIFSYQNNHLSGNTTDGTANSLLTLK